ncbi:phospholipid/cholesterol/gamma-HCH transport system substrate-binding protein [Saccharothrix carnea]|uniref:Phospholipid/cholesterol/gamma-HCH transport system substrate-binding protein n=1 Tax=Saccharothrix carnea TaxID=1280637 RepID=A0A2P8I4Z0_SACCR|nr:MlaD family protein [Saccharothrix carnea]PSL53547.1 phospholipid/cholesterol/gamma-HCH transport system substrate-binding protein [Saccharothrix carnea]
MTTRRIRLQIALFSVIALLGVTYVSAKYVGLVVVDDGYVVRLELARTGGLFTGGEVTYRGVPVGRVGPIRLGDGQVEVELRIEASAPRIPADLEAVVANRSAVGEQYVDLRPKGGDGPYLDEGSVIPRSRTTLPLPVEQVLTSLDDLARSVPVESLRTVVDELDQALRGTGPDLQVLLDATTEFIGTAGAHLPQTTRLLNDAVTVLGTQVDHSAAINSFADSALLVAERLRAADGDLRRVIGAVPGAATEVSALLRESGPNLGIVLANLLTTADVLVTRQGALEEVLVTVPDAVSVGASAVASGQARFGLALTFFEPPPCTAGYETTPRKGGLDTSVGPFNTAAGCTLPPGSATGVRGSQNAPR